MKPRSAHSIRGGRPVRAVIVTRRTEARANEEPCWLCGDPIDYSLLDSKDTTNDGYPEMDHVLPVAKFPQHAADPANVKPSHRLCNGLRSDSMTASGTGQTSQDWEGLGED